MDEEKKKLSTTQKANEINNNNALNVKRLSAQKSKVKPITNFLDKKIKGSNQIISSNNNSTVKNLIGQKSDRNSISAVKKNNTLGLNSFQKKLTTDSSVKNLEYSKKASNLLNSITSKKGNPLYPANISPVPYSSNINSSNNLEANLKEKENFISINNENTNFQENPLQRNSLNSAECDMNPHQVSLLEQKNTTNNTTNNEANINAFSNQNSIYNISSQSDSSIKVIVRFRPMNKVENVSYFIHIKNIILEFTLIKFIIKLYYKIKFNESILFKPNILS